MTFPFLRHQDWTVLGAILWTGIATTAFTSYGENVVRAYSLICVYVYTGMGAGDETSEDGLFLLLRVAYF